MDPYKEPSKVDVAEGKVIVDGPDGVAVTMTPDAAIETSERLLQGGLEARGQQVGQEALDKERRDLGLRDVEASPGD